jgi:hypothetical protein
VKAWSPIGEPLRAAIELALRNGGLITSASLGRIIAGAKTDRFRVAYKWRLQGWFERTAKRGVYRCTSKAIARLDAMESIQQLGWRPADHGFSKVRDHILTRGAVCVADAQRILGIKHASARQRLYEWRKAGLLRRTHRDTYRLEATK